MKNIAQPIAILISLLTLPLILFGQAKPITEEQYISARNAAESETNKQVRRRVSNWKSYDAGEGTSTGTTDYIPPDRSRWIDITTKGTKVERIEQITIGETIYRKEDDGPWIKRTKDSGGFGIGGREIGTREFFKESVTIGREKLQVLIRKMANYNNTYFDEDKMWVNSKGLIVKTESTTKRGETLVSRNDVTYDYKAKPAKIVAPIK